MTRTTRPRLATVLAALALCVVLGGTATAASGLINGKKIKPGTITAKQIRNKTITKTKLAPATLAALKGPQGPKGEKGDKGEKGIPGPQGIPGSNDLTTYSADKHVNNVPANSDAEVLSFNLPSSKYLVIAKAVMFSQTGGNHVTCGVEANNGGGGDEAQWTSTGNISRTTVPLVLSTTKNVNYIEINCNPGDAVGAFTVDAVVIPVG